MIHDRTPQKDRGFTLLEVITGLAVTVIILGGVFAIAGGAIDLSARSNRLRQEEIRHTQFSRFLRKSFNQLPGQSKIVVEGGSSIAFLDAGALFSWPGVGIDVTRTVFRYRNHSIELVQWMGDSEIASLPMMQNITSMAWEVYDTVSQQWSNRTSPDNRIRPSLIKLRYKTNQDVRERVEVFLIPTFTPVIFHPPKNINRNEDTRQ